MVDYFKAALVAATVVILAIVIITLQQVIFAIPYIGPFFAISILVLFVIWVYITALKAIREG